MASKNLKNVLFLVVVFLDYGHLRDSVAVGKYSHTDDQRFSETLDRINPQLYKIKSSLYSLNSQSVAFGGIVMMVNTAMSVS